MSLLDSALNLATGGVAGGLLGLAGTFLTHRQERLEANAKRAHELAQAEVDLKTLELEVAGRERIATIEAETAQTQADVAALNASYQIDKATYGHGKSWLGRVGLDGVDIIRGLVRPAATAYLLCLLAVMWRETQTSLLVLGTDTTEAARLATLQVDIGTGVLFLATSATTWWFGTRASSMRAKGK